MGKFRYIFIQFYSLVFRLEDVVLLAVVCCGECKAAYIIVVTSCCLDDISCSWYKHVVFCQILPGVVHTTSRTLLAVVGSDNPANAFLGLDVCHFHIERYGNEVPAVFVEACLNEYAVRPCHSLIHQSRKVIVVLAIIGELVICCTVSEM